MFITNKKQPAGWILDLNLFFFNEIFVKLSAIIASVSDLI